jgi:cytochrome c6
VLACSVSATAVGQSFDAAKTFHDKCAMCHGKDGISTFMGRNVGAADLNSAKVQSMSDKDLHETIDKGKNKMPAYGKALGSDKNIDAMVKYVRTLDTSKKKK